MSTDKTRLMLPGQTLMVPRFLKRLIQVLLAAALSAAVILAVMTTNGLFAGRGASWQSGMTLWLAFIARPDIHATMLLTALVTVMTVYWQLGREGR